MLSAIGTSTIRAAAVIPVVLLVVFLGLLWLLGLACGRERRRYVIALSQQATGVICMLLHGPGVTAEHRAVTRRQP